MNKKISPTLIGAFVVGALALLVIAVIAFGSGQLFRHSKEFVLYFDGGTERKLQVKDLQKNLFFLVRNDIGEISWAFPVTCDITPHRLSFSSGEGVFAA